MPKLGEAFVVIRAALGPLKAGLAAARSAVAKAMSVVTNTIKKAMSVTYKYIKRAMLAVGAALLASVYAFAKFSEQMANVSTMLDDQSMHYMPRYSKAIKQLAVDFGEGTASLSKGLYDILSASIAPAKALEVLGVAAKAAKAGLTTTAVAADAITTILNAYAMSADKAGNVSDILFATVKRGKLTFYELAQSVGKVAATAAVAGLSFEEVSAAIATMTRSGLNAFLATTALRSIMSGFLKPMESAKKAAKGLGIELNSTTLRTIGLTGVLEKLKDASPELLAALIPNRRALAGFAAMIKNTTGQLFDLNLMLNSAGLTQKAYEKMTGTLKFSLDRLKQSFVILATTIGSTLAPAFKFITDLTIGSVKKWIDYLEKHKFEVMRWSVAVATRINFVRGVLQDFAVGAFKNWPETWKFMKDVAVGQLDVIWKSFAIAGQATIVILVEQFKALGKSLGHIFGKVWSEFENRAMVAGQRAVAKQVELRREFHKALAKMPKEKSVFGLGLVATKEAEAEAWKTAREKVAQAEKQGIFEIAFPAIPTESWGDIGKKIEKAFVPALEYAKKKLAEVQDKTVELQSALAKRIKTPEAIDALGKQLKEAEGLAKKLFKKIKGYKGSYSLNIEIAKDQFAKAEKAIVKLREELEKAIKIPDFAVDALEKRLAELQKLEKSLQKQIAEMKWREKWEPSIGGGDGLDGGDGGDGADGADGGDGTDGRDGLAGKINFVGLKDAWKSMAQSLQPKDKTQENILKVNRDMYKELREQTHQLSDLEFGMVD